MIRIGKGAIALAGVLAMAGLAHAEEPGRTLRVIGDAPSAVDPAPKRFVIDAEIKPGDAPFQSTVHGWFAAIGGDPASAEIEGACVEARCALAVDLDAGKLAITGDLAGPGAPGGGQFVLKDDEDGAKPKSQGPVSFSVIHGPIDGVGELAAPDAVTGREFNDLLLWNDASSGFSNADDPWPNDTQREALATWQGAGQKPMTGLIVTADLQALRAHAQESKAKAGWTALGGAAQGWSAGYPAVLLPKAGPAGAERRFESADGKAVLILSTGPAVEDGAMDALMYEIKGHEGVSYTRVNGDLEYGYEEKGVVTTGALHSREHGSMKLVFTYPSAQDETYVAYKTILPGNFRVEDDFGGK